MSDIVFSNWKGAKVDSRQGEGGVEEVGVPTEMSNGVKLGGVMGWDGLALWEGVNAIDLGREYAKGLSDNSCGQCVPCRIGSRVVSDTFERICAGEGEPSDVEELKVLADRLREQAMCDLGQSCGKAFQDLLENFGAELDEAISAKQSIPRGEYITATTAPCKSACPAHLEVPTYVELIKKGQFTESLDLIRRDNCLPGTVGRVCVRPCEFDCRRANVDGPIQIKFLKRFVADYELERKRPTGLQEKAPEGDKIAVVGAGPAGLSCAYYLTQMGYHPVVFEALGEPGGMAAVGIPDYRLPRPLLRHECDMIEKMGAEIHYNTDIGTDIKLDELTSGDYKAVFLGIGARLGTSMGVEGEGDDIVGFYKGADYLRDVALGRETYVGKTAIVVGGGNVAIDCARTALRAGFENVKIVYRRSLAEMPADDVEVNDAVDERIDMMVLHNPIRIVSENKKVTGVEVVEMELGEPDESGRRRPVEKEGSQKIVEADCCIMAIGQTIDLQLAEDAADLPTTRWKTFVVQGLNKLATIREGVGVFAGGDCEAGPDTLIGGLAAGKEAACQIDQFIKEGDTTAMDEWVLNEYITKLKPFDKNEDVGLTPACEPYSIHHLPADERVKTWDEVEIGFTHEEAIAEASRCLRCYRLMVAAKA